MDWAEGFYSTTGRWWGAAESGITQRDHDRVALVRAGWAGDISHRAARPDAGYLHALTELTDFDPVACRFTDTWWEQDRLEQRHTQTGRCYTPADFRLLLEGTGLTLAAACVARAPIDLGAPHPGHAGLLRNSHEWTAVLTASLRRRA